MSPRFSCRECGHAEPRWFSQCVKCLSFGTLRAVGVAGTAVAEDVGMVTMNPAAVHAAPPAGRRQMIPVVAASGPASPLPPHTRPIAIAPIESMPLSAARIAQATAPRTATGMPELDRVLGGGFVHGSFVLIGGDAGLGKSTLLLQAADKLARRPGRDCVLYATGEENAEAIALRAQRLGIDNDLVHVVATDDLDAILDLATANKASALVIDSIQKMRSEDLDLTSSAASRLPVTVAKLAYFAHGAGIPVIAIGQITKDGSIAGPKSMEHDVDVVLYLEGAGGARRRLVALKNRSGSADEVGMFEMRESGLVCIEDTSGLPERAAGVPGSAVFPMVVGERVQLVEVQALVGGPKSDERPRGSLSVSGVDPKRVAMILAVLARHAAIDVSERDVFVSVTAGARVADPAADLPIALAIASSYRDLPIDPTCAAFGELGLAGEVRSVAYESSRVAEAQRAGFGAMNGQNAKTLGDAIASAIGEAVRS